MSETHDPGSKRSGSWLPPQADLEAWLEALSDRAAAHGDHRALHPSVQKLQELIDGDALLRLTFNEMLEQVPGGRTYAARHLHGLDHLLALVDEVLTMAPEFDESSMVGTPLNAVLDWPIGTPAGFAAFRDPRVNARLREILDAWCTFLSSAESLYVLNDSPTGWKSAEAQRQVGMDQYEHDPRDKHWGFRSWNDFFTRRFRSGERPVAAPDDDKVIVSACESTPLGISTDVQRRDRFWIKSQPYSLHDMLAGDESVEEFVGGTVYQAFLSALNYHRWHSPVAGTIVRAVNVAGTYYSEADSEGKDAREATNSQSYMAHVATRAIILIQADDPVVGLMAFIPVGMSEVSSCLIDPKLTSGYHVEKGQELGRFQYGGSTHCLVFRLGAIADFALAATPQPHKANAPVLRVCARLAVASSEP